MYGLSCAQTKDEDEDQSVKRSIRAIEMKSVHFGRIDFEIMCAFIGCSIWIFGIVLVATELQHRLQSQRRVRFHSPSTCASKFRRMLFAISCDLKMGRYKCRFHKRRFPAGCSRNWLDAESV